MNVGSTGALRSRRGDSFFANLVGVFCKISGFYFSIWISNNSVSTLSYLASLLYLFHILISSHEWRLLGCPMSGRPPALGRNLKMAHLKGWLFPYKGILFWWPRYITSQSRIHHRCWNIAISQPLHNFPWFFLLIKFYLMYIMHSINCIYHKML